MVSESLREVKDRRDGRKGGRERGKEGGKEGGREGGGKGGRQSYMWIRIDSLLVSVGEKETYS